MSDPFLIPSIISGGINALGSVGQGVINWFSQNENRKMQIDLANNSIQRRMEDLKKANINPLMAGKLGGAETPTLQAPQMTGIENAVQHITPNAIQKRSFEMQQQQMNLNQTEAETARIHAEKEKAITEAALNKTTNEWYGPRIRQEINLSRAHEEQSKTERIYIDAKTATENILREPRYEKLKNEATSAKWKEEADRLLPDLAKAEKAIQTAKASWAKATSESEAQRADAIAKMLANELSISSATVDNELAKKQLEFLLLQSRAGQEAIATQLAKATYGANVAKPYIENILRILQAGSIGKDMMAPKGPLSNISPELYKSWGW